MNLKPLYQTRLAPFNVDGATMDVEQGGSPLLTGVVLYDLQVLRVNPHFDSKGKEVSADVWVLWRPVGYEEDGLHTSHLIRVVEWKGDSSELLLTDDEGRLHRISPLLPETEPLQIAARKEWLSERGDVRQVDAEIYAFFEEQANNWIEPGSEDELEEDELVAEKQL